MFLSPTCFETEILSDKITVKAENKRPFKVWSSDHKIKKSVAVSSLQDLINTGCKKLKISPPVRVLEEDGTEVDDEDYFSFLPDSTTLIISPESSGCDEVDTAIMSDSLNNSLLPLAKVIKKDPRNIIQFTDEQLQLLVDTDTEELAQLLGSPKSNVESIQDACQRHLDEKAEAKEALEILKLYHSANGHTSHSNNSDKKRKLDT